MYPYAEIMAENYLECTPRLGPQKKLPLNIPLRLGMTMI